MAASVSKTISDESGPIQKVTVEATVAALNEMLLKRRIVPERIVAIFYREAQIVAIGGNGPEYEILYTTEAPTGS